MQSFFAYHSLQSLAFALLNSLWQMAFLWIIYNIAVALVTIKPSTNFKLLVATQITGFIWFVNTLFNNISSFNLPYYENYYSISNSFIQEKLLPLIAVIYLFLAFVFITKFFIQFYNLKDIRHKELLPISNKWQDFINTNASKINIANNIQIKISKNIVTPLTIGFLKPIILIPIAAINHLSPQQMEAILLHELAHIKRNDYLINLMLLFIDGMMFFNPFSKYFNTAINTQRELCCDDVVLQNNYANNMYAEALLNVAKSQLQSQKLVGAMTAVNDNQQQLKYRIKRILNIETDNRNAFLFNKQMAFTALFGLALFILIGFINVNVKSVIAESAIVSNNNSIPTFQPKSISFNETNLIEKKAIKKVHLAKNISNKNEGIVASEEANTALKEKKKIVEKGFQFIGKLAAEDDMEKIETATLDADIDANIQDVNENNIVITSAIEKHPTTTVQKYFVPATSKSPASMIIVTTTEKENGKKVVKIEIEKGDSKVE